MELHLLLCLILPVAFLILLHIIKRHKASAKPPGPWGIPILGNLFQLDAAAPHIYLWQLSKKYGPLMSLKLGSVSVFVVSSPRLAKEVMNTHDIAFCDRPKLLGQQKLSYNGSDVAFSPYGQTWRELRKISVVHLLSTKQVHSFRHVIDEEVSEMISKRGLIGRLDKVCKSLDEFYQGLIDQHLDPIWKRSGTQDILDLLIKLKQVNGSSIDLTWDHIKGVVMDLVLAANDTTAATITWAMTALMQNPTKMKILQQEIRGIVQNQGRVKEDDITKFSYLKAVIKEAMRLHPPIPLLVPREARESCILEGYKIPLKTQVYINAYAIARDPEYWDNPEEFLPERFLNNDVDIIGNDFQVIPFGAGRRICPGITMGLAIVELALSNLVYSFNWELPHGMKTEDIDVETYPGITMHKKNQLCLVPSVYSVNE